MTDFALMDYQKNLINKYVKHVKHCLYNAEHGISKICSEIYNMEGMTGKKRDIFTTICLQLMTPDI
jgi:hypothetical protein